MTSCRASSRIGCRPGGMRCRSLAPGATAPEPDPGRHTASPPCSPMVTATIDGATLRSVKSALGEHRASIHGKSSLALSTPQAVDEAFDAFVRGLLVADQRGSGIGG